jgi:hypothetical protein
MYCKHHLPFESPCSDCLMEALWREQARDAHFRAAQPTVAKPRLAGTAPRLPSVAPAR